MRVSESVRGLRVHCQWLAAVEDLFVLGAVVVGEAIGVAGQRAGDLPDGGRDRHRQGRGEGFAERLQVPDERSCRCPDSPAS